jgi:hypothetical protein
MTQIVFPPQFEPFQAYLSGPYLGALLVKCRDAVSVVDANIDFYDWIVEQKPGGLLQMPHSEGLPLYLQQHAKVSLDLIRQVPVFLGDYRWAVNVADEYLNISSPKGVRIGLTSLRVGNRYSSADLRLYLNRPDNIFNVFFAYAAARILGGPQVVTYLISIVVIDQLAASVAFAREIRRCRPRARILAGGPLVSRLYRQLTAIQWLAAEFDAFLPGEACKVLPNALGLTQGYDGHVTPDFSDLDLDRYWSCRRVLPYLVAHGCKWGKCAFCSHHLSYDGYRASRMRNVVADLESLSSKHNAHHVSFCDEYLTPAQLNGLADGLLERQVDVKWSTFARAEPCFRDAEFLHKLYMAGCRLLMFGLESGSQRVLQAMGKGTKVEHYRPILEACKAANIAVRCDFMVGFPGEDESDVQKTYDFIRENRDVLDTPFSSFSVAVFELRDGTLVQRAADKYGLSPRRPLRGDLDDLYDFESRGGMIEESRAAWRQRMIRLSKQIFDIELIAPQNKTHQLIFKDLYDQGLVELPVSDVREANFPRIVASLARGVVVRRGKKGRLRVISYANGGELDVDAGLAKVFSLLKEGTRLYNAFTSQSVFDPKRFAVFIDFLHRNDYLVLRRARGF